MAWTYQKALDYFFSLINYEKDRAQKMAVRNFRLSRVLQYCTVFDNPQQSFHAVHIAGTKGKGSTAEIICRMIHEHTGECGIFTSPHIHDIRERIRISDRMISKKEFTRIAGEIEAAQASGLEKVTYFEAITIASFLYFRQQNIQFAVVETGLGGRLDATNVLAPAVTIITRIALDHMEILGDTTIAIAGEKAGIIKKNIPVILADQDADVLAFLKKNAQEKNAPVTVARDAVRTEWTATGRLSVRTDRCLYPPAKLYLRGEHQLENVRAAVAALEVLYAQKYLTVRPQKIAQALSRVIIPGRFEIACERPCIILDVAHNPHSMESLCRTIKTEFPGKNVTTIFGCLAEKDYEGMLISLGAVSRDLAVVPVNHPYSANVKDLACLAAAYGRVMEYDSSAAAFEDILNHASNDDLILITGSFYLVCELRQTACNPAGTT